MQTYTTLDGQVLDLSGLAREERAFLERCYAAYRRGLPWVQFCRLVEGTENPLLAATGGRVTRAVWEHPLFQAVSDLEDRLGILQGELAGAAGPELERDPLADEWIPAAAAARAKGVSLPGLHEAIRRGQLLARPVLPGGRRLVVSANSLHRWKPNAVRQAAGRRVGAAARG